MMATTWYQSNDEGYWSSDERIVSAAKRQKSNHVTSASQETDSVSSFEIAELCYLMEGLTLETPPLPPPVLIVTDDMDTPNLIEARLRRIARIGMDKNLEEINREADELDFYPELEAPRVWPQFLHPLWQSRLEQLEDISLG
jgi:hypothetical protein